MVAAEAPPFFYFFKKVFFLFQPSKKNIAIVLILKDLFQGDNLGIFLILFFFILFSIFIILRLYNLQINNGEKYRGKVVKYSKRVLSNRTFDRGKIYFKKDDEYIPVAIQKNGFILTVDNIHNKFINNNKAEDIYEKINKIIKIKDKKLFLNKVLKKNSYRELEYKLNYEDVKKIKDLKIKGLSFIKQSWREYPLGETGGKIIGFLDIDNNGVNGLEKYYNDKLERKLSRKKKNIFLDIFSKETDDFFKKKEVVREGNLYSTIDVNVQNFLEKKLKSISKKYSSKNSLGIVMKVGSGEIVAMADDTPQNFNLKKKDYRNKLVEVYYEPGSIIKPLVVAAGLDLGSINKNFSYEDRGCIKVQTYKICNYDKRARGKNTGLVQIIKESLNLGMVQIERNIKNSDFLNYFIKLGLSEESGIDLPNERTPNISSLNYNIPINYATASFGQGVAISPIAMMRSLAVIANDGYLVKPHIVKEIRYDNNIPSDEIDIEKKKIFKDKTIDEIKNIMVEAVNTSSSKSKFLRKMYSVGAKTGTAQIAAKGGGYKENANIHAFFGFFPANAKPEDRYAILLYTMEPKAKYSSQTLTKPFFDILDYLISYYDIKPDRIK